MTQFPGNSVTFSVSLLSLMPWAQQNTPGHPPFTMGSHRPHIPCATTTLGLQPLSAVAPEQKTPNLPTPFLCLKLCLAQIQPLSLCFPQGKNCPLQTAAEPEQAAQGQEGAGEPDTKHGCSPACQDHPLPQEAFGDPCPIIPMPPSPSLLHREPKAKADTPSPSPALTAAAAPSSAQLSSVHPALLKKAGLTPAPRKCLV